MDLEEKWERALRETRVLSSRLRSLLSLESTELPYVCLAESSVNIGDTVVRQGKVVAHRPLIIVPSYHYPQFEGFDFQENLKVNPETVRRLLLMRGVSFPSLKYRNEIHTVDVYEGHLDRAIAHYSDRLERREDTHSGLIAGPEDCWQLSVIIYVATLSIRSAPNDLEKLLEEFRRRHKER